jgi:hypothetical protein
MYLSGKSQHRGALPTSREVALFEMWLCGAFFGAKVILLA